MAQLKDSIIQGNLRVSDSTLTDTLQTTTIKAPTTSGGTTYGVGSNGQALKSNGTTTYWGDIPSYSGMTDSEISAGTGTTNRLIAPVKLKSAIETYGKGIFIGTCSTTSGTNLVVSTDSKFQLLSGVVIAAIFDPIIISTLTTINVNSTGAIPVSIQDSNSSFMDMNRNTYQFFVYSGTSWVWFASNHVPNSIDSSTADFDRLERDSQVPRLVSQNDFEDFSNLLTFSGRALSQGDDLNDYTNAGVFRCTTSSIASTLSNTPVTGSGFELLVYKNDTSTDNCSQLVISISASTKIYCRAKTTSGWTNWGLLDPSISGMTASEIAAGTSTTNRLISPANLKTAIHTWETVKGIDSTPTSSSTNAITSGSMYDWISKAESIMTKLVNEGAKNKLPNNATSTGIFTVNSDGTVTAVVPDSNAQTSLTLFSSTSDISFDTDMVLSGTPTGGGYTYRWSIYLLDASGNLVWSGDNGMADEGDTRVVPAGTAFRSARILIRANVGARTLTFKPMLCTAREHYLSDKYEPYAPTNRELYESKLNVSDIDSALSSSSSNPVANSVIYDALQGKGSITFQKATNYLRVNLGSPTSTHTLSFLVGKLDSSTNYIQFYANGVDKGYIKFDVSRNLDTWSS